MRLIELHAGVRGSIISEARGGLKIISPAQARERNMFGPLYHGTSEANMRDIIQNGFQIFIGNERSGQVSHGYTDREYANGAPAPIHHLGFGIYFTTSKANVKNFGTTGRYTFYIDAKPDEINFGSPKTMMAWWVKNGYDPELAKKDRVAATKKMTSALKKKNDAIWFKGKGIRRLLDGDQVVVFDTSLIYGVDAALAKGLEVGAKVERRFVHEYEGDRTQPFDQELWKKKPIDPPRKGRILNVREIPDRAKQYHPPEAKAFYSIKFDKGGTEPNVYDVDVGEAESSAKTRSVFRT